jgi:dTMP kinase
MRRRQKRGKFIVIEGVDHCGKTTQAKRLVRSLKRQGVDAVLLREPGGTIISEKIRRILLSRTTRMCPRTEVFLYLAARAQVTAEKIAPALGAGRVVVADRFHLSTYAYQIGGRGMPTELVMAADRFARHALQPDLTIVLDITPAEARRRRDQAGKKPDRIEQEKPAFFARIRRYYQQAAQTDDKIILLRGRRPPEELAAEIEVRVRQLLT